MRKNLAALILIAVSGASSAQEWHLVDCLSEKQQQYMLDRAKKLIAGFGLESLRARYVALLQEKVKLSDEAFACTTRLNDPFRMLNAVAEGCVAKTEHYKEVVNQVSDTEKALQSSTQIVNDQLTLERRAFPFCKAK